MDVPTLPVSSEDENGGGGAVGVEQLVNDFAARCNAVNELHPSPDEAAERVPVVEAYEKAVNCVGCVPVAGVLWVNYARYVESWPQGDVQSRGARTRALRKLLQRCVVLPLASGLLEELWRSYERFETAESEQLARELLPRFEPLYFAARATSAERKRVWDKAADSRSVRGWRQAILFEKNTAQVSADSLVASPIFDDAIARRVACAYRVALCCLSSTPELWHDWAVYVEGIKDRELDGTATPSGAAAAERVYAAGVEASPRSSLLASAYAALLERSKRAGEAGAVLESLVTRNETDALAWALLQRHARRHSGVDAAREVFARTRTLRVAGRLSPAIYLAHATMELHANGEPAIAQRVYELALSQFIKGDLATDPPFVLAYASLLEQRGDKRNARALLERAISNLHQAATDDNSTSKHEEEDFQDMDKEEEERKKERAKVRAGQEALFHEALVSLLSRTMVTPDAASAIARLEERLSDVEASAAVWRDVSSLGVTPADEEDRRWCLRCGTLEPLTDLAAVRSRAQRLLAQEAAVVKKLLPVAWLSEPLRRLIDRLPRGQGQPTAERIDFVLDALRRTPLPPAPPQATSRSGGRQQQRKRKNGDDDEEEEEEEEEDRDDVDAFKRRRRRML